MRTKRYTSILVAVGLAFAATGDAKPAKPVNTTEIEKKPEPIEKDAINALRDMGAFLRKQQSFSVRVRSQTDYVMNDGQKIKLGSQGDLRVQRPDHLRADVTSDRKDRQFFYDGKTFTLYGPALGFYSQVPAPATLNELADELTTRYGIQLPLVDLFRWGTADYDTSDITSAMVVGPANLNGVETQQYAFRQKGVDWQIWIEKGPKPVPRRLVVTTTDDKSRPEYSADLVWNLGVTHDAADFVFTPPKDAQKIVLNDLESMPVGAVRSARRPAKPMKK